MFWRFLEIHMKFMLIRRFFMYFADFWAIFCDFLTILFYCLKWVLKRPLLFEQFLDNKWLQFGGHKAFIVFLSIFYAIQRIWIVLGRCLFYYDSKRSIGVFFKSILWEWILKQEMKHVKLECFCCWTKSGAKREWFFVHIALF